VTQVEITLSTRRRTTLHNFNLSLALNMPRIRQQAQAAPPDSSQHFCTRCRETLPGAAFARARNGRPYASCNTCRDRRRQSAVRGIAGAGHNTRNRNVGGSQVEPRMLNPGEPLGWLPISGLESVEPHNLGRMDTVCDFCDAKHWLDEKFLQHSSTVTFALFGDTFYILVSDVFSDQSAGCN
jgi:hypothetical protein